MKRFILLGILFFGSLCAKEHIFYGEHLLASYAECEYEALTDLPALKKAMKEAVMESGATILDISEYVFEPDAITMVILLSESHASIHTYPEYQSCFVDIFTCGNDCKVEKFHEVLQKYLKPKSIHSEKILRK